MAYDPYPEKLRQVRTFFASRPAGAALEDRLARLDAERTVPAAEALLDAYFDTHRQGDVRPLRQIAYAFSDKRLVRDLVRNTLADGALVARIASLSYPHPIGFDKMVLADRRAPGGPTRFKFRLHVYWRSPQDLKTELIHLHRFEMASAPITGELTNHLYALRGFDGQGIASDPGGGEARTFHVYSGYERDTQGVLHKRLLGRAQLVPIGTATIVPGQSYAQRLEHAHYVETNAETGHTNGDVCSTIYIHGAGLTDPAGRRVPILFEERQVPDAVVPAIRNLKVEELESALRRYLSLLEESLNFYAWLYDPRYGRNLSVGMVAGYLLSEAFGTARTIAMWEEHRAACVDVLESRGRTLCELVRGERVIESLPSDDRTTRYLQQLINKSWHHAAGQRDWLAQYGDLVKEFERYLGALLGDYARNPDLKVLKPIWELDRRNLAGGAHYGNVHAMLEAARAVQPLILERFRTPGLESQDKPGEGPVTEVDHAVQRQVRRILSGHFPEVAFAGEEVGPEAPAGATRRFLVDPIDGTRNYVNASRDFAVSICHQQREGDVWVTTDAVVTLPAQGEIYWAERGEGAYHIGWNGHETRLAVPAPGPLAGRLVDLSVRGFGERELTLHRRLMDAGVTRRGTGCAALMLCMVSGTGNGGAIITANEYDVAGGLLVAAEAGARCSARTFVRDGRAFTVYVAGESEAVHGELARMVDEVLDAQGGG